MNRQIWKPTSYDRVRADNRQGMFDLTQHLLRLGYQRLAMVTMEASVTSDVSRNWPVLDRIQGFRDAVAASKRR